MNFTLLLNYSVKMKECKKIDKYFDLARELKNLLNKKVTVIPIITGILRKETGRIRNQKRKTLKLALLSYLPTPPLGQDMTQGQFLSGV